MTEFMKFRKWLILLTGILIIIILTQINYDNLSFKTNKTVYIMIISGLGSILALYLSNKIETKKNKKTQ
ncbi:MAG: hypothetical protein A2041_07560 [Bacteroidetes bacterium GWA2_31_9b]|nr:MAG: hypothetical protein A2041_07560 [Bacteroidetes bacterium GWA2_31_9b]